MKRLLTLWSCSLLLAGFLAGCDTYVEDIDPPIDTIPDERLNDPAQIPFLVQGVHARFADTYGGLALLSGGLSDEFFFDQNVPGATFPTYKQIDEGDILLDNNSVDGVLSDLGELRFLADNLVERIDNNMPDAPADLATLGRFIGYFYGGVARYFWATYFGLNPEQGGGVIDAGPFIPSDEMYDLALEKLNAALQNLPQELRIGIKTFSQDELRRVVNSVIARVYLFKGDYAAAAQAALNGMQPDDPPFLALFSVEAPNDFYFGAGPGRAQFVVDWRFVQYLEADPKEAERIPLADTLGNDKETIYYRQDKYPAQDSPIPFMTWQENHLMLAELGALHGQNIGGADPLALINEVRTSHGLDPYPDGTTVTEDLILEERDKELFAQGIRLPDQRRFDRWHLPAGTWKYLPITQNERNANPNL